MNAIPSAHPGAAPGGPGLASPRTALLLGIAALLLVAAAVPLTVLSHQLSQGIVVLPFGIVGFVVARRQSGNPIGWILIGLALIFLVSCDGGQYGVLAYRLGYHLPAGRVAVFLADFWIWLIVLLPLPIALFPDGRLPRRWRWATWGYIAICLGFVAASTWSDVTGILARRIRVDAQGELVSTDGGRAGGVFAVVFVACCLAFVVRLVIDYRRSSGEYRQQLKWLLSGGVVSIAGFVFGLSVGSRSHNGIVQFIGGVGFLALMALPIGMGVGILKYRLYDIDRLISRTVAYTILTATLAAVFLGVVVFATDVLPFSSPVAVAASTLAVAALFNPLRLRVQRLVDRRFNRARYDAEAIVAAFSTRLREAVDLDTARHELVAAVELAMQPAHASLWVRATPARRLSGS